MAKRSSSVFVCQECGAQSPKWLGRCADCGAWNTLVETVVEAAPSGSGRGGSASMVDDAKDGDDIAVSPPHNDFPLIASAAGYTFIAGGIGITPILSMIRHLKSA